MPSGFFFYRFSLCLPRLKAVARHHTVLTSTYGFLPTLNFPFKIKGFRHFLNTQKWHLYKFKWHLYKFKVALIQVHFLVIYFYSNFSFTGFIFLIPLDIILLNKYIKYLSNLFLISYRLLIV